MSTSIYIYTNYTCIDNTYAHKKKAMVYDWVEGDLLHALWASWAHELPADGELSPEVCSPPSSKAYSYSPLIVPLSRISEALIDLQVELSSSHKYPASTNKAH